MIVMDFASSVLENSKDITQIKEIVVKFKNEKPIIVVSGLSKSNKILTEICNLVLQNSDKTYLTKVDQLKSNCLLIGLNLIPKKSPQYENLTAEITQIIVDLKDFLKNIHLTKELSITQKNYLKSFSSKLTLVICKNFLDFNKIATHTFHSEDLIVQDLENSLKTIQLSKKKSKQKISKYHAKKIILVSNDICKNNADQLIKCDNTAGILACVLNSPKLIIWTPATIINQADSKICPKANINKTISINELQIVLNTHNHGQKYLNNINTAQCCKITTYLQSMYNSDKGTTKILTEDNLSPHTIKGIYSKKEIILLTIQNQTASNAHASSYQLCQILSPELKYYFLNSTFNQTNIALSQKEYLKFSKTIKKHKNIYIEKNYSLISIVGVGLIGNSKVTNSILESLRKSKIEVKSLQQTSPQLSLNLIIKEMDHDLAIKTIYQTIYN